MKYSVNNGGSYCLYSQLNAFYCDLYRIKEHGSNKFDVDASKNIIKIYL